MVVETWSSKTRAIGTVRHPHQFAFEQNTFAASDLLLANRIQTHTPFPESREDLRITPNPMRTYYRHNPVFIYLEIYNLKRDNFGQTHYEITYQLQPPKEKEIDPALFVAIDLSKKQGKVEIETFNNVQEESQNSRNTFRDGGEENNEPPDDTRERQNGNTALPLPKEQSTPTQPTTYQVKYVLPKSKLNDNFSKLAQNGVGIARAITAEYEGNTEHDFTFLQIDVAQVPVGIHQLILTIKDLQNQKSVRKKTLFRVIE